MVRVTTRGSNAKTATLIWLSSALLFFLGFRMALRNSSHHYLSTDFVIPPANWEQRSKLYDKMARDLDEHGTAFLKDGATSQSLALSDIFTLKDGNVTPIHKPANPPVRANVLYLSPEFSVPIAQAVKDIFLPYFDRAIWFQNSTLYHFSMFHASHHVVSVPATEDEIETEANAVKDVAEILCPLKIVLDRVVLTSTGVLLGCWQVVSGTEPMTVRAKLRNALPRAPEKQLYDPTILHTTFARLFGNPKISSKEQGTHSNQTEFLRELVKRLNNKIQGVKAVVSELWFVEEFDVLALALNGKIKARRYHLGCSKT